ncbi:MAG TPA: methylated-DNA--[protein]-cysteine S-methyltransferase [Planctomycetota bacterium]|nr:methylated-DNA--[protein]-cysteine S-methyltransferase [Planctomycetota bacterium]
MIERALPSPSEMQRALTARDPSYDGVFFTGVRTTGIFCRPTCPARRPRPENVEFFATAHDALLAGFRPCLRCRPMEPAGERPQWLAPLLDEVEKDPSRRWRDRDLRARGLEPGRVRRWFVNHHRLTFQAYSRARRLSVALGRIREGGDVTGAAFASGYDSLSGFHEAFRNLVGKSPTKAKDASLLSVTRIPTPLGPMIAAADERALFLLEFADRHMLETQLRTLRRRLGCAFAPGSNGVLKQTADELAEYFAGRRRSFGVPLQTPGTSFQNLIWDKLARIPGGETVTYGGLARAIGRAAAVRAVAKAVGDNRIAILVPCHRVVGSDGNLTGYGGGLWRKRRLLELERNA